MLLITSLHSLKQRERIKERVLYEVTDHRLESNLEAHRSLEGWVGTEKRVMLARGLLCMPYFIFCYTSSRF